MTPNWKLAEQKVARLIGGKVTPGSGNKYIRGDAVNGRMRLVEVKQTNSETLTVQHNWFHILESYESENEVALAIFFFNDGYVYYPIGGDKCLTEWSTKEVKHNSPPQYIQTYKQTWELDTLDSLKTW